MAAVTFSYTGWIAAFPEFSDVTEPAAQAFFARAGLMCANDTSNPAYGAGILPQLLDLLTAHIAWLNSPRGPNGLPNSAGPAPAPSVVGRIASASEGSVSVSTDWNDPSGTYFLQTRYGAEYWQATAQFRTMRYSAYPTVVAGPIFPYRGRLY